MIINGKTIFLRPVVSSDANERYLSWMRDREVTKYLESRLQTRSIQNLRVYVNNVINDTHYAFFAIILKEDKIRYIFKRSDLHIGNIKMGPINQIHKFADIGIMIGDKDYWGKGIATEAIKLVTKYAFEVLKLHRLVAGCYSCNTASIMTFLNAGFLLEGILFDQYWCDDEYVDGILLGIVNSKED